MDELAIVDIPGPGMRPVQLFDLERVAAGVAGDVYKERNSFKFVPGEAQDATSQSPTRWGGARPVGQRHGNGQVTARWAVKGPTAQTALANVDAFLETVKYAQFDRLIRWRPTGAAYPTYFEQRGPGTWTPDYRSVVFGQTFVVFVDATWPVAPLALWDQCDVVDDFSVDSRTDYAFDGGASTDVAVAGGALAPVSGGALIAGVSGVELWLKPESLGTGGSAIASWADSSGNGNNAVQATGANQPVVAANVLDGFKVARFDGVNDFLAVAGITNNDPTRTVFIVARLTAAAGSDKRVFGIGSQGELQTHFGGADDWGWKDTQAGSPVNLGGSPVAWSLVTLRFDALNSCDAFVNGTYVGTFDPHDSFGDGAVPTTLKLGANSAGTANFLTGDIAEVISLNRSLVGFDADRLAIWGYLSDRFPTLGNFGTKPPVANTAAPLALTADHRARHTVRGYKWLESGATRKFTPGATITGFKGGVTLRDDGAGNRIEAYVDDDGVNSRLRIDVILAGVRTNRASVNLAARIVNGTPFWLRARIEGQTVFAEHFTSAPSLSTNATTVAPAGGAGYALAGGEQLPAGWTGFTWIPQVAAATLDDYFDHPFYRRAQTLPKHIQWADNVPGGAGIPALADVVLGLDTPAATPWALVGWARRPNAPLTGLDRSPVGIIEAETAGSLATWAAAADANYRGGNGLKATAAGAGTARADFFVRPDSLIPDDFAQDEIDIEVWARMEIASTLVTPKAILSMSPNVLSVTPDRYSAEYGAAGKLLAKPSAGTVFRTVRLGTVTMATDLVGRVRIRVAASWAVGSTGTLGLDQLTTVPILKRVAGPTGRALDAAYPRFLFSSAVIAKKVRSDGSGLVDQGAGSYTSDVGLGGQLLIDSGQSDSIFALSSLVPDDPTSDASNETRDYVSSLHLAVRPRSQFARAA